jgi:uncharacterized membrane protein
VVKVFRPMPTLISIVSYLATSLYHEVLAPLMATITHVPNATFYVNHVSQLLIFNGVFKVLFTTKNHKHFVHIQQNRKYMDSSC